MLSIAKVFRNILFFSHFYCCLQRVRCLIFEIISDFLLSQETWHLSSRASKMDLFYGNSWQLQAAHFFSKKLHLDVRLDSNGASFCRTRFKKYPFSTTVLVVLKWAEMVRIFLFSVSKKVTLLWFSEMSNFPCIIKWKS